jgi:hypothetical protein
MFCGTFRGNGGQNHCGKGMTRNDCDGPIGVTVVPTMRPIDAE